MARSILPEGVFEVLGSGEISADESGERAPRFFRGRAEAFEREPWSSMFLRGSVADDVEKFSGWTVSNRTLTPLPGGMAELRVDLEKSPTGATGSSSIVELADSPEYEFGIGGVAAATRKYSGPRASLADAGWMAPGSEPEDMPGYRVRNKAVRGTADAAIATVSLSTEIASEAGDTSGGSLELEWQEVQEPIQRHFEFADLTYDQIVQATDFVRGDKTNWDDVDHDGADSPTVQAQKKLARLLIAGRDTVTMFLPVVRQTLQLPDSPETSALDETLLVGYAAGITDAPPIRVLAPDGSEYSWVKMGERPARSDSGRWVRVREWRGYLRTPTLGAEGIEE